MICYIMCILLWIAYLWLDCMVVAYAFEPRRDSVRQAGIILGLMAAQLPAAALKFLFNDNVLVRYGAMIAVGIVTVAYAAVFLKGTIGQKVLFMLCEYLTALLAEMLSIGILNKYMEQKPQLSYYTPTMVLLLSVVLTVTAIFFLIFLVVWKKIVEKESFDVSIIIVFSVFPVSQLLMITAINEQVFRNMTLYTGWILAAAILGSVADGVLLYTLLRQQQLQELKLRLSEVQSTWEMARNHYHEIENRREELAKIRHDMRNQQMVLQELLHQGEYEKAEKMLETLTDTVAATTEYLYCGDPVFNAIMGETEEGLPGEKDCLSIRSGDSPKAEAGSGGNLQYTVKPDQKCCGSSGNDGERRSVFVRKGGSKRGLSAYLRGEQQSKKASRKAGEKRLWTGDSA